MRWSRILSAPRRGPGWLVPSAVMLCWLVATATPPLGYYRELGLATENSVRLQLSTLVSRVDVTLLNVLHLPAFFAMAWLWCWALRPRCSTARAVAWALLITGAFAVASEGLQLAVPLRTFSFVDLAANLLGVGLASLVYARLDGTGRSQRAAG